MADDHLVRDSCERLASACEAASWTRRRSQPRTCKLKLERKIDKEVGAKDQMISFVIAGLGDPEISTPRTWQFILHDVVGSQVRS